MVKVVGEGKILVDINFKGKVRRIRHLPWDLMKTRQIIFQYSVRSTHNSLTKDLPRQIISKVIQR